jgi:hypothetical protein
MNQSKQSITADSSSSSQWTIQRGVFNITFIAVALFAFIFFTTSVSAYDYTASYVGYSGYGRVGLYPSYMGEFHGVYAGGNYPHYYQNARVQTLNRLNTIRYNNAQYNNNYYTTNVQARRYSDPRYRFVNYWGRCV